MVEFLIFMFLFTGVAAVFANTYFDKYNIKRVKEKNYFARKYFAPLNYDDVSALCKDGGNIIESGQIYGAWKKDCYLCLLNTVDSDFCNEKYYEIHEDDILYYRQYGEEYYYSHLSGGGGGGSSLGGAVIGGVLGGSTGAIIGSRKNAEEIQTKLKHINNKETFLIINQNEKEYTIVFDGDDMYKKLIKLMPNKSFEYVIGTMSQIESTNNINKNIKQKEFESIDERLKKLGELVDKNLISLKEYEEKKKEILSEI